MLKSEECESCFTIREAMEAGKTMGLVRSLIWWRTAVHRKKIQTVLLSINGRLHHMITDFELARVVNDPPHLKVMVQ